MELRVVRSPADVARFLALPRSLHNQSNRWIEPLRSEQAELIDQGRHPFYAHAQAEFFLAIDPASGRTVGRIAAIRECARQPAIAAAPNVGHFGFFETIDSQAVASALLDAAAGWLRGHGANLMLGPASPSPNYEYGLLMRGFEQPHRLLLPYNPPYYQQLLANYGLGKAKDLLVYECDLADEWLRCQIEHDARRFERLWRRRFPYIHVRQVDLARLADEVPLVVTLIHKALVSYWDYAPMSPEELHLTVRRLRPLLEPDLMLIAERRGVPVGIALAIPDFNEAIGRLSIRHSYLEQLELYARARLSPIRCARLMVLGVSQDQATTFGIAPFLLLQLYQNLLARGYTRLDSHWMQEDNAAVLGILRRYGLQEDRVYRVFSKPLD